MRKATLIIALLLGLSLILTVASHATSLADAIRQAKNSTLFLMTEKGMGSGVVIDSTHVLTARHILMNGKGDPVLVMTSNSVAYEAEVTWVAEGKIDLAILTLVDGDTLSQCPVKFAENYDLGDKVFATGYAWQGMEMYPHENVPDENLSNDPQCRVGIGHITDVRVKLIYCDIGSFDLGMSGGGIFNMRGELIGINSWTPQGEAGTFRVGTKVSKEQINEKR